MTVIPFETDQPKPDLALDYLAQQGIDPEAIASGLDVESDDYAGGPLADKAVVLPPPNPVPTVDPEDTEFSDTMSVTDQLDRYPDTCMIAAPVSSVYNLSLPDDIKAWNELQARTIQSGTKSGNLLLQHTINFFNGSYYVLASARAVSFLRLIP